MSESWGTSKASGIIAASKPVFYTRNVMDVMRIYGRDKGTVKVKKIKKRKFSDLDPRSVPTRRCGEPSS